MDPERWNSLGDQSNLLLWLDIGDGLSLQPIAEFSFLKMTNLKKDNTNT